jgi:adenosylcobinamide-GDP ribazoletransferase
LEDRLGAFVAMGAISRWSMVFATVTYPTARASGLGWEFKQAAGRGELIIATATAAIGALLAGTAGIAALILALAATAMFSTYVLSKIPGLTGDVYGAISEGVETFVAVALPPLWRVLG